MTSTLIYLQILENETKQIAAFSDVTPYSW